LPDSESDRPSRSSVRSVVNDVSKHKSISHDPKIGNKSTSGKEKKKRKGKNNSGSNIAGSNDNGNMVNLNQLTAEGREKLVNKLFDIDDSDDENDGDPDNNLWSQPQLKAPDLGDPIAKSLAELMNTACTNQCKVNNIIGKYKVHSNCEFMNVPCVNKEIWGELV
jgi:hypothetical protein